MSPQEIELLIYEQALRNTKDYVARCRRRVEAAQDELTLAINRMQTDEMQIKRLRDAWLMKTV